MTHCVYNSTSNQSASQMFKMHNVKNARNLVSYFSGKYLKLMPPDALILAQNAPALPQIP